MRGTPQQIIDKYNQLARDAQLSNDRVAAENFQQHAEHYMRMLSEAQREQDVRREEQERQNRERQAERDRERNERIERQEAEQVAPTQAATANDPASAPQPDVLDLGPNDAQAGGESGLVETPESTPRKPRRPRTRKPAPKPAKPDAPAESKPDAKADTPAANEGGAPEAAE